MPGPQSSLRRLRKLVCAPGIHVFASTTKEDVDGRDKPGHDENNSFFKRFEKPFRTASGFSVRL